MCFLVCFIITFLHFCNLMKDRISKIITSRRLSLTKRQFVLHYFFVLFFPLIIIVSVQAFIHYNGFGKDEVQGLKTSTLKFVSYSALAIAIAQYMNLKMTEKLCDLTTTQFDEICELLVKEMHWCVEAKGENYIICTTPAKWYNWGTLITIVKNDDVVLFNSICDLHNRPSLTAFGQNARNYRALHQAFSEQLPD